MRSLSRPRAAVAGALVAVALVTVVVRLVPVLPFTVLNYACGATAMRLRHYAVATVIGLVPGTTALVALGGAGVAVAVALLVLVSVGLGTTALAVHWWRRPRSVSPSIPDARTTRSQVSA